LNKKVLVIAVALMAVAMLATPVMASPAEKIPVTLNFSPPTPLAPPEKTWTTNGDILQIRGLPTSYNIILTILGEPPLFGVDTNTLNAQHNLKTDVRILHYDVVWTFSGGTFEGRLTLKIHNNSLDPIFWYYSAHLVFQGTGAFEGQTIMMSYEGPFALEWSGYLLRH
jgi:hypothetical protein